MSGLHSCAVEPGHYYGQRPTRVFSHNNNWKMWTCNINGEPLHMTTLIRRALCKLMSYKQVTKTGKPVSVLVMGYKLKWCDLYTSQISAQLNIYGRLHTVKETASAVLTISLSKQSQICVGLAAVLCLYCLFFFFKYIIFMCTIYTCSLSSCISVGCVNVCCSALWSSCHSLLEHQ